MAFATLGYALLWLVAASAGKGADTADSTVEASLPMYRLDRLPNSGNLVAISKDRAYVLDRGAFGSVPLLRNGEMSLYVPDFSHTGFEPLPALERLVQVNENDWLMKIGFRLHSLNPSTGQLSDASFDLAMSFPGVSGFGVTSDHFLGVERTSNPANSGEIVASAVLKFPRSGVGQSIRIPLQNPPKLGHHVFCNHGQYLAMAIDSQKLDIVCHELTAGIPVRRIQDSSVAFNDTSAYFIRNGMLVMSVRQSISSLSTSGLRVVDIRSGRAFNISFPGGPSSPGRVLSQITPTENGFWVLERLEWGSSSFVASHYRLGGSNGCEIDYRTVDFHKSDTNQMIVSGRFLASGSSLFERESVNIRVEGNAAEVQEGGLMEIEMRLTGVPSVPLGLRVRSSGGTATAGVDYLPIDQLIRFGPGETKKTFTVQTLNDRQPEANETICFEVFDLDGIQACNVLPAGLIIASGLERKKDLMGFDPYTFESNNSWMMISGIRAVDRNYMVVDMSTHGYGVIDYNRRQLKSLLKPTPIRHVWIDGDLVRGFDGGDLIAWRLLDGQIVDRWTLPANITGSIDGVGVAGTSKTLIRSSSGIFLLDAQDRDSILLADAEEIGFPLGMNIGHSSSKVWIYGAFMVPDAEGASVRRYQLRIYNSSDGALFSTIDRQGAYFFLDSPKFGGDYVFLGDLIVSIERGVFMSDLPVEMHMRRNLKGSTRAGEMRVFDGFGLVAGIDEAGRDSWFFFDFESLSITHRVPRSVLSDNLISRHGNIFSQASWGVAIHSFQRSYPEIKVLRTRAIAGRSLDVDIEASEAFEVASFRLGWEIKKLKDNRGEWIAPSPSDWYFPEESGSRPVDSLRVTVGIPVAQTSARWPIEPGFSISYHLEGAEGSTQASDPEPLHFIRAAPQGAMWEVPLPKVEEFGYLQILDATHKWIAATRHLVPNGDVSKAYRRVDVIDRQGRFVRALIDPEPASADALSFGNFLRIQGDRVLVSEPLLSGGQVHVFDLNTGVRLSRITNPLWFTNSFGNSLASDSEYFMVSTNPGSQFSGYAVYRWSDRSLVYSAVKSGLGLGSGIALSGGHAFATAPLGTYTVGGTPFTGAVEVVNLATRAAKGNLLPPAGYRHLGSRMTLASTGGRLLLGVQTSTGNLAEKATFLFNPLTSAYEAITLDFACMENQFRDGTVLGEGYSVPVHRIASGETYYWLHDDQKQSLVLADASTVFWHDGQRIKGYDLSFSEGFRSWSNWGSGQRREFSEYMDSLGMEAFCSIEPLEGGRVRIDIPRRIPRDSVARVERSSDLQEWEVVWQSEANNDPENIPSLEDSMGRGMFYRLKLSPLAE